MNLKTRKTTDFFRAEYVNWASYSNLRQIASLVDGQKNAARKILWYTQQKNLKNESKVSQLNSKVAEETEYLHGDMSGVIVNLAQDYTGTNNINLLYPEGNFGSRIIPKASASRYIYTYGAPEFFKIFNKEDTPILEHQDFEGHQIEPKFLLPRLPMLLINGSEGISSGFAQKILPRNPVEIEKYIKYYLKNPNAPKKPFKNKPYYRGFKGNIKQGESLNQWVLEGCCSVSNGTCTITELPIGYSLKSYIKVLDKLEEQKKIISYKDFSQDEFLIEVKINRAVLARLNNELLDYLKLRKTITENYTVMSEENTIKTFDCVDDILQEYTKVRLKYLQKRKEHLIKSISKNIKEDISRYIFVRNIVQGDLVIFKRPTCDIKKDLEATDKIIKRDDSFDYLLNMNIYSLTKEKMEALMNQLKKQKETLDFVRVATMQDMWLEDLK